MVSVRIDVEQVIPNRARSMGGQRIARVLPFSKRRAVGPFVFLDHFGPVDLTPGQASDVPPHPHIGLATVSYLFAGSLVHRDSLGSVQVIQPGALNWMSAGSGIVHSERSPRPAPGGPLHGLQFWVALPRAHEQGPPSFRHHPETDLPAFEGPGYRGRVLIGEAYGQASLVATPSPTLFLELHAEGGAELPLPVAEDRAVYPLSGTVITARGSHGPGQLVVLRPGPGTLGCEGPTHLVVFGGAPLDGPRFLDWNFVASDPQLLQAARQRWREGHFPKIPGDEEERASMPE